MTSERGLRNRSAQLAGRTLQVSRFMYRLLGATDVTKLCTSRDSLMHALSSKASDLARTALVDEFGSHALQLMWALRQDAAQAFGPLGFRTVRALLLEFVGRGHTQPKELAELLGVVPPAVSTMIAELTERGFLARQGHPEDGRRVQLSLTETGERARAQLRDAWNKTGIRRLGSLSDAELETFVGLCRKLFNEQLEPLQIELPQTGALG